MFNRKFYGGKLFCRNGSNNNRIIKIVLIVLSIFTRTKPGKLVSVIPNEMEVQSGGLKRYIKAVEYTYYNQTKEDSSKTDWIVKVGVVVVFLFNLF